MDQFKIITLNICTIVSNAKLSLLYSFLRLHDVDVALLQEIATPSFNFPGYEEAVNVGPRRRGTAILFKQGLPVSHVTRLPSGRAMSARLQDMTLINIYAPAGTQGRKEREHFFTTEIAPLLASAGGRFLWAGDFNAVLSGAETTGTAHPCSTLKKIVNDMGLTDVWRQLRPGEPGYTYVAPQGACASRLDKVYLSARMRSTAQHVEVVPSSISDHHALLCTLDFPARPHEDSADSSKPSRSWKVDPAVLQHEAFVSELGERWKQWRKRKHKFPTVVLWWEDCKRRLRGFCSEFSRQARQANQAMLEFRTACLAELYAKPRFTEEDVKLMKKHKEAVNKLLLQSMGGVLERSKCERPCPEDEPNVHHVAARLKRARVNNIKCLHDEGGAVYDTQEALEQHVHGHFEALLSRADDVTAGPSPFLDELEQVVTEDDNEYLLAPITVEELRAVVKKSPKRKSPGEDGLTAEFYQTAFDVIAEDMLEVFNCMLQERQVADSHTKGVMVLVPKVAQPRVLGNLRPVTLLNADGKMLSRILAIRLSTMESRLLHPLQCRAGQGRNMYDELTDVRDAIASVNLSNRRLRSNRDKMKACLVSMDFAGAFNHVRHEFIWEVLRRRGVSREFIALVQSMYRTASSRVRVNGRLTAAIWLRRGIRQGCPLSMLLFNIIMEPLIRVLDQRLRGLELPSPDSDSYVVAYRLAASAYVDDALAVLTEPEEMEVLQPILDDFGDVSGLRVNTSKTFALPLGGWDQERVRLPFPYVEKVKVLGVTFSSDLDKMAELNWRGRLGAVRATLADARLRLLSTLQRVTYVNTYALSLVWHLAQVIPLPAAVAAEIEKAVRYFVWGGRTFKVPLSVMARPPAAGGLSLQHARCKAAALFAARWLTAARATPSAFSGAWLSTLTLLYADQPRAPAEVAHYNAFRAACGGLTVPQTTGKQLARDIYLSLLQVHCPNPPHVALCDPAFPWDQVWAALSTKGLTLAERSSWYLVVCNVVSTKERLHRIRRAQDPLCDRCGATDNLVHRLTACPPVVRQHWDLAAARVADLLGARTPASPELVVRPALGSAPKRNRQQAAVLLAEHVHKWLSEQ